MSRRSSFGLSGWVVLLASGCSIVTEIDDSSNTGGGQGGGGGSGGASTSSESASTTATTNATSGSTSTGDPVTCDEPCDDGNACTDDRCLNGACVFTPRGDGSSCDDGLHCNGPDICRSGACEHDGIDDGNQCTVETCDEDSDTIDRDVVSGCATWQATGTDGAPSARTQHTAVWTGSRMVVWGGSVGDEGTGTASGASYDPGTKSWTSISEVNAPSARLGHRALWTGSRMIVWGGFASNSATNTGGIYDPIADSWTAMSTQGAPNGRMFHSMVWTGEKVVVFGGFVNGSTVGTGGIYDPATNSWSNLPGGAPSSRMDLSGFSGDGKAVFWGGTNLFDWLGNGRILQPNGTWLTVTAGGLSPRDNATVVWTGSEAIFWGGFDGGISRNDGARLSFASSASGTWSSVASEGAPGGRTGHVAVWTGSRMFIWGGCNSSCSQDLGDGALYQPTAGGGTWTAVEPNALLSARRGATAVWTGSSAIVWGGTSGSATKLGNGAQISITP